MGQTTRSTEERSTRSEGGAYSESGNEGTERLESVVTKGTSRPSYVW